MSPLEVHSQEVVKECSWFFFQHAQICNFRTMRPGPEIVNFVLVCNLISAQCAQKYTMVV
jgi:hypothetical protein